MELQAFIKKMSPSAGRHKLFCDGDAGDARAGKIGDRHLKELRQKFERFAIPTGLRALLIDRIVKAMRANGEA